MVWITGIYFLFNRKKIASKSDEKPRSESDIIAMPAESKIRVVFDQNNPCNLEKKSLADHTVRYSDLVTGKNTLPKTVVSETDILTEKIKEISEQKSEKTGNFDLNKYVNILTIAKANHILHHR